MSGSKRWGTIAETAALLGLSKKGCYQMAAAGKLPAARVGRLVRIDLKALEADLEAQAQGQPAAARGKTGRG
jgi:excisionase family DNA binding protein